MTSIKGSCRVARTGIQSLRAQSGQSSPSYNSCIVFDGERRQGFALGDSEPLLAGSGRYSVSLSCIVERVCRSRVTCLCVGNGANSGTLAVPRDDGASSQPSPFLENRVTSTQNWRQVGARLNADLLPNGSSTCPGRPRWHRSGRQTSPCRARSHLEPRSVVFVAWRGKKHHLSTSLKLVLHC